MIQQESRLECRRQQRSKGSTLYSRILGGTGKRYASVGDTIVVTVKSALCLLQT